MIDEKEIQDRQASVNLDSKIHTKRSFREINDEIIEEKKQSFRSFFFKGFNDYDIYVRAWDSVKSPKGVVLLAHGMVEHGLRYNEFAKFLNKQKYIVVIPDLRAHGKTAGAPSMVGIYDDGDLFADIVSDIIKLADTLIQTYKLPLVLAGHSYGSFITQSVIQNYHRHSGVILIGSACFKGRMDARLGKFVANLTALFKGKRAPANMIYNMTFGQYAKGKEEGNWLSHNPTVIKEYNQDPYCGTVCSAEFYKSFFKHLVLLNAKSELSQIDKDKPILITSGEDDPVAGKKHKMLDKLYQTYKNFKISDVMYKLWENGYHEILNETFRFDVYNYIVDWLDEKII